MRIYCAFLICLKAPRLVWGVCLFYLSLGILAGSSPYVKSTLLPSVEKGKSKRPATMPVACTGGTRFFFAFSLSCVFVQGQAQSVAFLGSVLFISATLKHCLSPVQKSQSILLIQYRTFHFDITKWNSVQASNSPFNTEFVCFFN